MDHNTRSGGKYPLVVLVIALIVVLGGAVYAWRLFNGDNVVEVAPQMAVVKKEMFVHEILERGNVESSENVNVLCDVESNSGVTILWVIPEGSEVKKGDPILEFDASTFTESVNKQQIAVYTSEAKVFQSEVDHKNAVLELEEYEKGTFEELKKTAENKILSAKEKMRTSEDKLRFNATLFSRGYITESVVEAEEFEYEQAKNNLGLAEMEYKNLEDYTRVKMINSLNAKIKATETKLATDKESHRLEVERLEHQKKQLEKCKVVAPEDGQVVYTPPPRWGSESDIIREGKKVYERQEILKLPNPAKMQVKGLVNEASIRLVRVGHPASIELEAFPNQTLSGVVKTVNDYPEPTHWGATSMAREYQTLVTILDPPPGIKPGLTAKVKIVVNVIPEALQLPIQAVFEHGGKTYCVTYKNGIWDKVEVKTGATNENFVVIESGLSEGDEVVLNSWQNRDKLDLPKIEEEEKSGPLTDEFNNFNQQQGPGGGGPGAGAPGGAAPAAGGAETPRGPGGPGGPRGPRPERTPPGEQETSKPAEATTETPSETAPSETTTESTSTESVPAETPPPSPAP